MFVLRTAGLYAAILAVVGFVASGDVAFAVQAAALGGVVGAVMGWALQRRGMVAFVLVSGWLLMAMSYWLLVHGSLAEATTAALMWGVALVILLLLVDKK